MGMSGAVSAFRTASWPVFLPSMNKVAVQWNSLKVSGSCRFKVRRSWKVTLPPASSFWRMASTSGS